MTVSLNSKINSGFLEAQQTGEALLGKKITRYQPMKGGRNSRVFKYECEDGQTYAAKFYYFDKNDTRNRLAIEYTSIEYLWKKGMSCIPEPIMISREKGCAIYQYVPGNSFAGQEITRSDIDQALAFFVELNKIKDQVEENVFTRASEACFSLDEIVANIDQRMCNLERVEHPGLEKFLAKELRPFTTRSVAQGRSFASRNGIFTDGPVHEKYRTLSPSDFGFHNAVKMADGRIVYFDFEYFGWDDPAKTIADFLLHPAMTISEELKGTFTRGMLDIFAADPKLAKRLEMVYPLYGIKWCLIFLNEFLKEDFSRRAFADQSIDRKKVLEEQLSKAKNMLAKIQKTYGVFPYAP